MRLFLDTGPLVAAISPRDAHHEAARKLLGRIVEGTWREVHTSDLVVAEALNFIRFKIKRKEAAEALLDLVFGTRDAPAIVTGVLRVHAGRFAEAVESYKRHFDAGLSFTDHANLVLMREERIDELATFDGGFEGFVRVVRA